MLLWLAWGLFAVSFALPSIKIFGPVFGWNAAWAAIALPWEELSSGRLEASRLPVLAWLALLDLANLLAGCLPLLIWRFARGGGRILSSLLAVAMVGPWLAGSNPEGMLVGYYVWSASFSVALIALPIGLRTFAGMLTVALLAYIAALWH